MNLGIPLRDTSWMAFFGVIPSSLSSSLVKVKGTSPFCQRKFAAFWQVRGLIPLRRFLFVPWANGRFSFGRGCVGPWVPPSKRTGQCCTADPGNLVQVCDLEAWVWLLFNPGIFSWVAFSLRRTAFITLNLASDYFWSRGSQEAQKLARAFARRDALHRQLPWLLRNKCIDQRFPFHKRRL